MQISTPDNNPTIQFISYEMQGITNKDIYKTMIKKQIAFIQGNSIIPVQNFEEKDISKFIKLIEKTKYVQNFEPTIHNQKENTSC